jgi:hypothetical protein
MKTLAALLLLLAGQTFAGPNEDLIQALSRCDAGFFKHLAERQPELSKLAPMDTQNGNGYFKVPEQRHPTESRVKFSQPIEVAGVKFIGYFDEIVNATPQVVMYSWGLLTNTDITTMAGALKRHTWEAERLRDERVIYVRSEVWSHAKKELGWAKVATEDGLPKPGTVERVLMVEPYDGEKGLFRFGCSLQGEVTTEMLRDLRPDLGQ